MHPTRQKVFQVGALVLLGCLTALALCLRQDGPAIIRGLGSALLVGIPISGLICVTTALVSKRVRISIANHRVVYLIWAVAGVVILGFLLSSMVASANSRYGH